MPQALAMGIVGASAGLPISPLYLPYISPYLTASAGLPIAS